MQKQKKIAFDRAMASAKKRLTEEAKNFLDMAYGDLNSYLETQMEAEIKIQKKEAKNIWPNLAYSRDTAV